jgi:hypothetical protein
LQRHVERTHLHGGSFAVGEILFFLATDDDDRIGCMQSIVIIA